MTWAELARFGRTRIRGGYATLGLLVVSLPAAAAEFRTTAEAVTVLYDAPSVKAKPLFVLSRNTPTALLLKERTSECAMKQENLWLLGFMMQRVTRYSRGL